MPELPEVEVVRAGLERHVIGSTITEVEVLHPRPVRRDPRGPTGFADALAGLRANEARYFKNKYDHVFTVDPASDPAAKVLSRTPARAYWPCSSAKATAMTSIAPKLMPSSTWATTTTKMPRLVRTFPLSPSTARMIGGSVAFWV